MDNIHKNHRGRVRTRFINEGFQSFEDHQILELLLFYAIPYKDTNQIAHRLIEMFGSFSAVLEAEVPDLLKVNGVGESTATLLRMMPELAQRYFHDRWRDRPIINNTVKAGEYAVSLFVGLKYEAFYLVCLDSQNHVNNAIRVQEGTVDEAPVYPRLIVEHALRCSASKVILAHNHPGGSITPSRADIEVTRKLRNALESVAVTVIDHIIVAGPVYMSFAEQNLLQ